MSGEQITIAKKYHVFQSDKASGEPMDVMTEQQLYAWLRSRGVPEKQVDHIITQTDDAESTTTNLP